MEIKLTFDTFNNDRYYKLSRKLLYLWRKRKNVFEFATTEEYWKRNNDFRKMNDAIEAPRRTANKQWKIVYGDGDCRLKLN